MSDKKLTGLILRVGTAFAFLYPPLSAIGDPYTWIGYIPKFARGAVSDLLLLHVFGVVEVVLALWILSGKNIFIPSLLSAGILLLIVFFNMQDFPLLFRDLSIAAMPLALAVMYRPSKTRV